MKIVIIGNGAAGLSAASTIREHNQDVDISLITKEKNLTYSLCALPYWASGDLPQKYLSRVDKNYYKQMNIKLISGQKVIKILNSKKSVLLENAQMIPYDKVLIATGSLPVKPSIEGVDKKGLFFLDNYAGTKNIMDYLKKRKISTAVVVGAGFTGVEMALALRKYKIKTIIVELLDQVLARILDKDIAQMAEKLLEEAGVELKLNTGVSRILGKKELAGVMTQTGDKIECEMVIVSVGVKPNTELLNNGGIKVNKGIVVDEYMQTNVPDIYAAGDVVETPDLNNGQPTINAIWPSAIEQGKIAGLNMLGQQIPYTGFNSINVLNINGTAITTMGVLSKEVSGAVEVKCSLEHAYRKLILQDGIIRGYQGIGFLRHTGFIWSGLKNKTDVSKIKDKLLSDSFIPVGQIS